MPMYAVRLSENPEHNGKRAGQLVGFYYAPNIYSLVEIVDEVTDPTTCDYARLPFGGIEWHKEAPVAAGLGNFCHENENISESDINDGNKISLSMNWLSAFIDGLKWKAMLDNGSCAESALKDIEEQHI